MKIGIISDTHNNETNMEKATDILRSHKAEVLIHCGDLTSPELLRYMHGFRVIYVMGNMDVTFGYFSNALKSMSPDCWTGVTYSGEIDGVPIAVAHGNRNGQINELAASNNYKYIFHGHTHKQRDETINNCRIINPGSLSGKNSKENSFCLLDLHSGNLEFLSTIST